MASLNYQRHSTFFTRILFLAFFITRTSAVDIFLEWNVSLDNTIKPASVDQPVIKINGMFPGPLINATTNDNIHVNVFNSISEPLLFTWNGIQQRLNSWQDGVSGTNCPILPGKNWTYVFQVKDQIGSFFYFPSINFQKAAGGFGPIRVNNRSVIAVPFPNPEAEFDLLIGDWYYTNYEDLRAKVRSSTETAYNGIPDVILMNGKAPYGRSSMKAYESFTLTKGKTYRFRISNVGTRFSLSFRIQNHTMLLVETEGSYTNQITLDSLDIHVGQSYSVLVTADQDSADYYIVATPLLHNISSSIDLIGLGVLHYYDSHTPVDRNIPGGPGPFDLQFSINQAKSIRWNMTAGAARPNRQGSFNVTNVTLSQTFILEASRSEIEDLPHYLVNNITYQIPDTPLKLSDHFVNGSGVYKLDWFPTQNVSAKVDSGVSVVSGTHKGWLEIVFLNQLDSIDSWHLDGYGFYVVGYGTGTWTPESRSTYNLYDPVVRSTTQVYPEGWTAVYAFLDNPGMWNLRSQLLNNWYLGQELYVRVFDEDPNPAKERLPPDNLLLCGKFATNSTSPGNAPASAPALAPTPWIT